MSNSSYTFIWLIVAIAFVIIEAAGPELVSIWFVVGAVPTMLVAYLGGALWLQLVVFLVCSIVALLLFRPIAKKRLKIKHVPTNADMVIGMTGKVIQTIDNIIGTGRVFVNGLDWSAYTESDDNIIQKDADVIVEEIKGVKLKVRIKE